MGNLLDYIDWRQDLSFEVSPFNAVDNYILTKIGKADFSGIVPADQTEIPIKEAFSRYFEVYGEDGSDMGVLCSKNIIPMMKKLPDAKRFSGISLSGFIRKLVPESTEQFSALTLRLPDGTHYVSFAGTDDTLLGWKENFMMGITDTVNAQEDAAEYLRWAADVFDGPLIVGGHSKGGNLAVFAAATASSEIQERITVIYNNDGPGFHPEFLQQPGYLNIKPRLRTLLPENTVVGTLLTHEENIEVVKCDANALESHDGTTWEVMGSDFVYANSLSRTSLAFEKSMDEFVAKTTAEERLEVINELFDVLRSTGAQTISDIANYKIGKLLTLLGTLALDSKTSKAVMGVIDSMSSELLMGR